MTNSNDNILVAKLDEFIRKYYKNQLIKGFLYSTALLITSYLIVVLSEFLGEFNTIIRSGLFYGFLGLSVFVLVKYIAVPLSKLYRYGKIISYEEAASIIGIHFTNVQDKLLNVLQLQNSKVLSGSDELLLAGIHQKINELKPVPFASAINISDNKRYLKYALPPLFITIGIALIWPNIISTGTKRLMHHQTYYEKLAPFQFNIENTNLKAVQQQDFILKIKLTGNEIPNEVHITIAGNEFKLEKENTINFSYTFKNVQTTFPFSLSAAEFNSKDYELLVMAKPALLQFNVFLKYPAYLNKKDERVANTGDMQIPQGTKVNWEFNTKNTNNIILGFNDTLIDLKPSAENKFTFGKRLMHSTNYFVKTSNEFVSSYGDSVNYGINVIADQVPFIDVTEKQDSLNLKNVYFSGSVKDDYGFNKLIFHYTHYALDSLGKTTPKSGETIISINKNQVSQSYYYYFDASPFNLSPGDKIEYYFEVWDNDGVNGSKPAKTKIMFFKAPTVDELNENTGKNNTEIKEDLEASLKKAKELQKELNDLARKMQDKKQLGWEEKKKMEDVLKTQKELEKKINDIKQENQANNKQQNEFSQPDESIIEKQKQLEQLFENIMTPEMKKMFEELQKLMQQLDKNQVQQKLEELKLNNKDIEKELDRALEAFKQMEVEQKMQQAIDKLEELAKKETELAKETEGKKETEGTKETEKTKEKKDSKDNKDSKDKKADPKELAKKQDDIAKEFDKLKEDLKDVEKKNAELEEPNALPKNEEQKKQISEDMKNSSDELNKNNKKDAAKKQKDAAKKMEEMKDEMAKAMESNAEAQQEENADALRQILENLLNLSFAQEELIKLIPKTRVDNPQFIKIPQQQNKLKDDSKLIEDSLLALSKRAPQISAIVNREISSINSNMNKTVSALAERNPSEAAMRMQGSMTSINNLALLLNEALEQMKKAQKESKMKGGGKCKKPGKGTGQKPSQSNSPPKMSDLQKQLNQQMQALKEALAKGEKPGEKPGQGKKPGQKPGGIGMGQGPDGQTPVGMPSTSEQLAKMAAQQEAMRRQIQDMMSKLKNKGSNPGGDIADMMEQTEKDLVNKQLTQQTISRQQDILTRLLESEKAERERDEDEKRKSNEAKSENLSNPARFLEYKRMKEKELELLNTVPPSLTPFYKEKVNNYFNSVSK